VSSVSFQDRDIICFQQHTKNAIFQNETISVKSNEQSAKQSRLQVVFKMSVSVHTVEYATDSLQHRIWWSRDLILSITYQNRNQIRTTPQSVAESGDRRHISVYGRRAPATGPDSIVDGVEIGTVYNLLLTKHFNQNTIFATDNHAVNVDVRVSNIDVSK